MFHIWSKGFKINFQNRKWNYLFVFQASDQETPFTQCLTFDPRGSKWIFKTGNGIIEVEASLRDSERLDSFC